MKLKRHKKSIFAQGRDGEPFGLPPLLCWVFCNGPDGPTLLPLQAQRELNNSRIVNLLAEVLEPGRLVRRSIVWMIEEVEEVGGEPHPHSLGEVEVFEDREVLIPTVRAEIEVSGIPAQRPHHPQELSIQKGKELTDFAVSFGNLPQMQRIRLEIGAMFKPAKVGPI